MSAFASKVNCHFVHKTEGLRFRRTLTHVPRVGDTLRFAEGLYYTVIEVAWCYDEDGPYERANIGIIEVKD